MPRLWLTTIGKTLTTMSRLLQGFPKFDPIKKVLKMYHFYTLFSTGNIWESKKSNKFVKMHKCGENSDSLGGCLDRSRNAAKHGEISENSRLCCAF